MKDELISLETAKLAKEKGFKLNLCIYNYSEENDYKIGLNVYTKQDLIDYEIFPAPTQSLLQRWVRKIHNIEVCAYFDLNGHIVYRIVDIKKLLADERPFVMEYSKLEDYFKTHEEALEREDCKRH